MMVAAALLLIAAYQSLGCFAGSAVRNLALGLSLTAHHRLARPSAMPASDFRSLAWRPSLGAGARSCRCAGIMQILFDQAARGAPLARFRPAVRHPRGIGACLFGASPGGGWRRSPVAEPAVRREEDARRPPGAIRASAASSSRRWRRVLGDRGVLGLIMLAPVLYGVFYPQPYLGQIRSQHSRSPSSTTTTRSSAAASIQALDADEAISVAVRATTLAERSRRSSSAAVFGILGIPPDTERKSLKGECGPPPGLCRFRLFPPLQPDAAGHRGIRAAVSRPMSSRAAPAADGARPAGA